MRRTGKCVAMLVCVSLAGCLSEESPHRTAFLERMRMPRTALGPDGVLVDCVLLERPLGDPFLNDELWRGIDNLAAGLEKKILLDENGFRVGQVIGLTPSELHKLLESERYQSGKRRQMLPAGTPMTVALGPDIRQCSFRLKTEDFPTEVTLENGQCSFVLQPALTNDGRTRLKFTPQINYGEVMPDIQVGTGRIGWVSEYKRPSKVYDALSFEVTLSPNQYMVIGTYFDENAPIDAPQSLGSRCFLVDDGRVFTQRVLVIRTTRGGEE